MSLRHDRRRLLLADEPADDGASEEGAAIVSIQRSSGGSSRGLRPRTLVPARGWTLTLAIILLVASVAGLGVAHAYLAPTSSDWTQNELQALSLFGSRNLSQGFAALVLAWSSLLAMHVYAQRRQRVDDYHGGYRLWIWIALASLIAGLCEACDLAPLAAVAAQKIAELASVSPTIVSFGLLGLTGGVLVLRFLLEIRRSRLTLAASLMTSTAFVVGVLADRELLTSVTELSQPAAARLSWLSGYIGMMSAFLIYSRHVGLELSGRIGVALPKKRRKMKAAPATETLEEKTRRSDIESSSPRLQIGSARSTSDDDHEVSRAERKRLRREARRAA